MSRPIIAVGAVLLLVAGSPAFAVEPIAVGTAAPMFAKLPGTDGKEHSLADLAAAKAVVVVFTCNHCPYAEAYEERLNAFTKAYAEKGVAVVAICASQEEDDSLENMTKRATERNFTFTYLRDNDQAVARGFGATVTPQFFVLDGARKVAYVGAFDNSARRPEAVTAPYVKDAVDAILAGTTPQVSKTRAAGCSIRYY